MKEEPISRNRPITEEKPEIPFTERILGFYNYTVIATLVGLLISLIGIGFAVFWRIPEVSAYMLLLAGGVHLVDGKIAKTRTLTPEEASFGRTLDLISDLTAFVFLPLAIGFSTGMETAWFWPFMGIYALAAVIRLSFLYVTDEERKISGSRHRKVHIGLPLSSIALILPVLLLLKKPWPLFFPWLLGLVMLVLSVGFLLRFKLPRFGIKGMMVFLAVGIVELLLLAIL